MVAAYLGHASRCVSLYRSKDEHILALHSSVTSPLHVPTFIILKCLDFQVVLMLRDSVLWFLLLAGVNLCRFGTKKVSIFFEIESRGCSSVIAICDDLYVSSSIPLLLLGRNFEVFQFLHCGRFLF
jgi:hypothetical protein